MATGSDTRRDRIENTANFIEQREQFVKTYRAICNLLNTNTFPMFAKMVNIFFATEPGLEFRPSFNFCRCVLTIMDMDVGERVVTDIPS